MSDLIDGTEARKVIQDMMDNARKHRNMYDGRPENIVPDWHYYTGMYNGLQDALTLIGLMMLEND
jgi:hypothetical protein